MSGPQAFALVVQVHFSGRASPAEVRKIKDRLDEDLSVTLDAVDVDDQRILVQVQTKDGFEPRTVHRGVLIINVAVYAPDEETAAAVGLRAIAAARKAAWSALSEYTDVSIVPMSRASELAAVS